MSIHTSKAGWIVQGFDPSTTSRQAPIPDQTNDLHSRQKIHEHSHLEAETTKGCARQTVTIDFVCYSLFGEDLKVRVVKRQPLHFRRQKCRSMIGALQTFREPAISDHSRKFLMQSCLANPKDREPVPSARGVRA